MSDLIDHIIETALEDENISQDEEEMIEVIRRGIWDLEGKIEEIIGQELSLDDAQHEIKLLFENVLSSAALKAKEDGTITADELVIIDRLAKYIRNEDITEYID